MQHLPGRDEVGWLQRLTNYMQPFIDAGQLSEFEKFTKLGFDIRIRLSEGEIGVDVFRKALFQARRVARGRPCKIEAQLSALLFAPTKNCLRYVWQGANTKIGDRSLFLMDNGDIITIAAYYHKYQKESEFLTSSLGSGWILLSFLCLTMRCTFI